MTPRSRRNRSKAPSARSSSSSSSDSSRSTRSSSKSSTSSNSSSSESSIGSASVAADPIRPEPVVPGQRGNPEPSIAGNGSGKPSPKDGGSDWDSTSEEDTASSEGDFSEDDAKTAKGAFLNAIKTGIVKPITSRLPTIKWPIKRADGWFQHENGLVSAPFGQHLADDETHPRNIAKLQTTKKPVAAARTGERPKGLPSGPIRIPEAADEPGEVTGRYDPGPFPRRFGKEIMPEDMDRADNLSDWGPNEEVTSQPEFESRLLELEDSWEVPLSSPEPEQPRPEAPPVGQPKPKATPERRVTSEDPWEIEDDPFDETEVKSISSDRSLTDIKIEESMELASVPEGSREDYKAACLTLNALCGLSRQELMEVDESVFFEAAMQFKLMGEFRTKNSLLEMLAHEVFTKMVDGPTDSPSWRPFLNQLPNDWWTEEQWSAYNEISSDEQTIVRYRTLGDVARIKAGFKAEDVTEKAVEDMWYGRITGNPAQAKVDEARDHFTDKDFPSKMIIWVPISVLVRYSLPSLPDVSLRFQRGEFDMRSEENIKRGFQNIMDGEGTRTEKLLAVADELVGHVGEYGKDFAQMATELYSDTEDEVVSFTRGIISSPKQFLVSGDGRDEDPELAKFKAAFIWRDSRTNPLGLARCNLSPPTTSGRPSYRRWMLMTDQEMFVRFRSAEVLSKGIWAEVVMSMNQDQQARIKSPGVMPSMPPMFRPWLPIEPGLDPPRNWLREPPGFEGATEVLQSDEALERFATGDDMGLAATRAAVLRTSLPDEGLPELRSRLCKMYAASY
jgi:hypothetical protein